MEAYFIDWANLLLRWLHVISGVAWIGASFYFVMLDNSLSKPKNKDDEDKGVFGELWAVHGGGVYHSQKFLAGPLLEPLSTNLHWSKWEAYVTGLSGLSLFAVIYWFGADVYLIDTSVLELSTQTAILVSIFSFIGAWVIYETLCRTLKNNENLLMAALFVLVIAYDALVFHLFSSRAAFIHVGAMMGFIMVLNVFVHIIPGQKKMVAEIRAGQKPNPIYGLIGKQRSVHNTYFTLPVLFIMVSNHYPMIYSTEFGWLNLAIIMLAGVFIRQFFVLKHRHRLLWWLPVTAIILLAGLIVALKPSAPATVDASITDAQILSIVQQRCSSCHAQTPTQLGFVQAPKGIVLETLKQVKSQHVLVKKVIANRYMPLGNITKISDEERVLISQWAVK